MKIVVGSLNEPKFEAVRWAVDQLGLHPQLIANCDVPSGINDHPISAEESMLGAFNRARAALEKHPDADFGVGIEGGLQFIDPHYFEAGYVCVIDRQKGIAGTAVSVQMPLPLKYASAILAGSNLTDVCREELGVEHIGTKGGFFGYLTDGRITRTIAYRDAVIVAFSALDKNKLYQ